MGHPFHPFGQVHSTLGLQDPGERLAAGACSRRAQRGWRTSKSVTSVWVKCSRCSPTKPIKMDVFFFLRVKFTSSFVGLNGFTMDYPWFNHPFEAIGSRPWPCPSARRCSSVVARCVIDRAGPLRCKMVGKQPENQGNATEHLEKTWKTWKNHGKPTKSDG